RVRQWAALHLHANRRAGGRGRGVVREANFHRDAVVAAIGAAAVLELELDLAATGPRQHADRLQPELVELLLVLAPAPPPGFVEADEEGTARADELLQNERMVVVASALGRAILVNREHLRGRLAPIALRVPVKRLEPRPDAFGFGGIGAESE